MNISWYLVILNGLIDSVNPCAIGVLLLYLTLMATWKRSRSQVLAFGLFYIISVYITYLLIGLGILGTVNLLGIKHLFTWLAGLTALFFGLFGLKDYFFPHWKIPVLDRWLSACRLPKIDERFTILGALILGFAVGVTEFPCSGAIYLVTISLLSHQSSFMQGLVYLLVYNVMFVLPLVFIFILSGNKYVFNRISLWQKAKNQQFKLWSSLFMLALGIGIVGWLILG